MSSLPNAQPVLRLDWCSYQAAKYACEKWHYSRRLSKSRNVYIGVWENNRFIGAISFGFGSGNATNGERYGLQRSHEIAELTRVALANHSAPVSRIMSIAIRMLRRQSPGLRMLISMADPKHGHHGGIYQATGWIYTGLTAPDVEYFWRGQWMHHRSVTNSVSAKGLLSRPIPGKYRYLYPLDQEMRAQIAPLSKSYPKRASSIVVDAPGDQPGEGGSEPTGALQLIPL